MTEGYSTALWNSAIKWRRGFSTVGWEGEATLVMLAGDFGLAGFTGRESTPLWSVGSSAVQTLLSGLLSLTT